MPNVRATFFFVAPHSYGWSETYWSDATSAQSAMTRALPLSLARLALLGKNLGGDIASSPRLVAVRCALDDPNRDSLIVSYETIDHRGLQFPETCDAPWTALLCRVDSGSSYHRQTYLRGIPDDLVDPDGTYHPLAAWETRLTTFVNRLIDDGWALRVQNRTTPAPIDVLSISYSAATATATFTLTGAHGLATADRVVIRGGGPKFNYRGRQRSFSTGASTFTIFSDRIGGTISAPITVQKVAYELKDIDIFTPLRVIKKNTGRPFVLPRGARRRR